MEQYQDFNFRGLGDGIVPEPNFIETDVTFSLSKGLFKDYVAQLHSNLETNVAATIPSISELNRYLQYLLHFRVKYCNREKIPFKVKGTKLYIPAFFAQTLKSIGEVVSYETGLHLMPKSLEPPMKVVQIEGVDGKGNEKAVDKIVPLDDDTIYRDMYTLSRKFKPFFDSSRIITATELPVSREGTLSFMDLTVYKPDQNVEPIVFGETSKSEPVYVVMAAMLYNNISEQTILRRISYGTLGNIRRIVYRIGDYEKASGGAK